MSRKPNPWDHLENSRDWRRASHYFLDSTWTQAPPVGNFGLCARCRKNPATLTDHKIPHRGNLQLFWDEKNFQGLCRPCHSVKTSAEDGGWGNPQSDLPPLRDYGQGVRGTTTAVSLADQERLRKMQEAKAK
jgi:5-methylcytosine-specific restriction endonuclease McrA